MIFILNFLSYSCIDNVLMELELEEEEEELSEKEGSKDSKKSLEHDADDDADELIEDNESIITTSSNLNKFLYIGGVGVLIFIGLKFKSSESRSTDSILSKKFDLLAHTHAAILINEHFNHIRSIEVNEHEENAHKDFQKFLLSQKKNYSKKLLKYIEENKKLLLQLKEWINPNSSRNNFKKIAEYMSYIFCLEEFNSEDQKAPLSDDEILKLFPKNEFLIEDFIQNKFSQPNTILYAHQIKIKINNENQDTYLKYIKAVIRIKQLI